MFRSPDPLPAPRPIIDSDTNPALREYLGMPQRYVDPATREPVEDFAAQRARRAAAVRASVERGDPVTDLDDSWSGRSALTAESASGRSTDRPVSPGCGVHGAPTGDRAVA